MDDLGGNIFRTFFIVAVIILLLGWSIAYFGIRISGNYKTFRSTEKIIPTYELEVNDNSVDTIWVYKEN